MTMELLPGLGGCLAQASSIVLFRWPGSRSRRCLPGIGEAIRRWWLVTERFGIVASKTNCCRRSPRRRSRRPVLLKV